MNESILNTLKNVIDPEIGINIVDLGLVYDIQLNEGNLSITMTLTFQGCPLGDYLAQQIYEEIKLHHPEVQSTKVIVTFDPPWDRSKMSDYAKEQLGG